MSCLYTFIYKLEMLLFGFPNFWLLEYFMKVIPEARHVSKIGNIYVYDIGSNNLDKLDY